MAYNFQKVRGSDPGFKGNTYRVRDGSRYGPVIGYVRQWGPGSWQGRKWQYAKYNGGNGDLVFQTYYGDPNTRDRATTELAYRVKQDRENKLKDEAPKPAPRPEPGPDGKTELLNKCGHTWRYTIRKDSAIEWLQGKDCPQCARGITKPEQQLPDSPPPPQFEAPPEPEPVPEPEPDDTWVQGILDKLPQAALFHNALPEVVLLVEAGLPVWLQGPPGTSKSTLAQQVAEALGLSFHPISCHELMTRSDLFGYTDANGIDHRTPLWNAYEHGGVALLDEVDNGNPNLLAALNSALSNGHSVFGSGTVVERHPSFRVVATANTAGLGPENGYIGRNGVDLATRDRFVTVMVEIDNILEDALAELHIGSSGLEDLAPKIMARAKRELRYRSAHREQYTAAQVTAKVRDVRKAVDSRFRGSVVSPRTTIHTATMVSIGFSLQEALTSKLVGLKESEVEELIGS